MMKKNKVKDIMVPISDYATVQEDSNLMETIKSLENQTMKFGSGPYRHRAVLVVNKKNEVVGKVSQVDIMRALEPNYQKIGSDLYLSRYGFSSDFMKAIAKQFKLWDRSLESMCDQARKTTVKDVMYTPADHQKVSDKDSLILAMHQIVMGQHQSLLVTEGSGKNIIGILRSTDVFNALFDEMERISV
jgi:CBS-domain-containing membrane protein